MARQPRLSPEIQEAIVANIVLGAPKSLACSHAGVPYRTFEWWMQRGKAEYDRIYGDPNVTDDEEVAEVFQQIKSRAKSRDALSDLRLFVGKVKADTFEKFPAALDAYVTQETAKLEGKKAQSSRLTLLNERAALLQMMLSYPINGVEEMFDKLAEIVKRHGEDNPEAPFLALYEAVERANTDACMVWVGTVYSDSVTNADRAMRMLQLRWGDGFTQQATRVEVEASVTQQTNVQVSGSVDTNVKLDDADDIRAILRVLAGAGALEPGDAGVPAPTDNPAIN